MAASHARQRAVEKAVSALRKPDVPLPDDGSVVRAGTCRTLQRLELVIEKALGPALSARPYWGLLLNIYQAEIEGKTLFQACLSTDEQASKPHRRSVRLAELGAVTREPDPDDHRRTDLRLTPEMRAALDQTMQAIVALFHGPGNEIIPFEGGREPLIQHRQMEYYRLHSTSDGSVDMNIARGKVIAGGRIALPADIRRSLGLQNGDTVLFELEGDEVRIRPARSALRRIQERLREFAPQEGLVSDELIADRRAEAARD